MMNISDIHDGVTFSDIVAIYQKWNARSSFSYLLRPRPDHGFMYVMCDRVFITYEDGTQEEYTHGNILYIPEGLRYRVSFADREEVFHTLLINFKMTGCDGFADKIVCLVSDASPKYVERFRSIITLFRMEKNNYLSIRSEFYALLDLLARHGEKRSAAGTPMALILPALDYIHSHTGENLRVADLAALIPLSESRFRKYFRDAVGQSPIDYILSVKLEKACEMLRSPGIPIPVIAETLGFYDSSYFYKKFTARFGKTPREYRERSVQ